MTKYKKSGRLPKLCIHKASGRGIVTDPRTGRQTYLGLHGTAECDKAYKDWIAEFIRDTRATPARVDAPAFTGGLMSLWLLDVDKRCRKVTGKHTGEFAVCQRAFKVIGEIGLAEVPVKDFNRNHIYQIRDYLVAAGKARKTVHEYIARIIRAFAYGESREWVDTNQFLRLSRWDRLRPGDAPAPKIMQPVTPHQLMRIYLKLPLAWRPIFVLHLYTGCRTENALAIRAEEISTDHEPWSYRPVQHKGRHRGHVLEILIGPRARAAIKPFMKKVASGSLWRAKGEILHQTYRKAFGRACQAARIETISPRQLRHTAASFLVNEGVSEAVIGSILGHRPTTITQRYAKIDDKVKGKVVEKYG
jgi:integrase